MYLKRIPQQFSDNTFLHITIRIYFQEEKTCLRVQDLLKQNRISNHLVVISTIDTQCE
ncbi:hypothetical protein A359_03630 [secondary endosymbiont of Ctenarytaina eucalypti]|uniref:Uncharacterized protein n=1 Tax=secondary endosymbiont of Ctenarytaina eucalypti TaxID=1199245 RepID=J3YRP2_9ENTR|nr:hypothetical protein A359_03630 [secondary endosymbiont of Ctenarytaina eucalypti]